MVSTTFSRLVCDMIFWFMSFFTDVHWDISFVCFLIFITTSCVILIRCSISKSLRCSRPSSMDCIAIEEISLCRLSMAKTVLFNIETLLFPKRGQIVCSSYLQVSLNQTTMQRSVLIDVSHCA